MLPALEKSSTALIIIDYQNDFCHEKGAFARRGMDVAPLQAIRANLSDFTDRVRAAGLKCIYVKTEHSPWTDSPLWLERIKNVPVDKVPVCREGSWGAEFYGISPSEGDRVVVKHRYSAFFGTDLDLILRSQEIKSIILTGVLSNVCVESTARDGYQLGYRVFVVQDCVAAATEALHSAAMWNVDHHFGAVVPAEQILNLLV